MTKKNRVVGDKRDKKKPNLLRPMVGEVVDNRVNPVNQTRIPNDLINVTGSTVGQCLDDLTKQYPGIKPGLFENNGKLHSYIDIYVNGESAYPEMLAKPVKNGDKLHIIFLIGGG